MSVRAVAPAELTQDSSPRDAAQSKDNPNTSSSTSFTYETAAAEVSLGPTSYTPTKTAVSTSVETASAQFHSLRSTASPEANKAFVPSPSTGKKSRAASVIHFIKLDGEALKRLRSSRARSSFAQGDSPEDLPDGMQIALSEAGATTPIVLSPEEFARAFRGHSVSVNGGGPQFSFSPSKPNRSSRRVHWADDRHEKLERVYYSDALHYSEGNTPYDDYEETGYSNCCTIC